MTVREVAWDLEGRFLVCETEAREYVPRLAIFNCEYFISSLVSVGVICGLPHF